MEMVRYCPDFFTLDIETTKGESGAYMYVWMIHYRGQTVHGRTYDDLIMEIKRMILISGASEDCRLVGYVHNLAYEYQFLARHFMACLTPSFECDVFATSRRHPIRCRFGSIELRDSLAIFRKKLESIKVPSGKHKLTGNLDYTIPRNSRTPLTPEELAYCYADVYVLHEAISVKMAENGDDLATIPMTATGYVRRDVRKHCLASKSYVDTMKKLTIDRSTYELAHQAFAGGHTHANAAYIDRILPNVRSFDIASDYPSQILANEYPMSKFRVVKPKSLKDFIKYLKTKCVLFKIEFFNIREKSWDMQDHIISISKCLESGKGTVDNGRIVRNEYIQIAGTEIDFECWSKFYEWDALKVVECRVAEKGPLPKEILEVVLKYYKNKTEYKGKAGYEFEYAQSKEFINSIYGMMVMAIIRCLERPGDDPLDWGENLTPEERDEKAFEDETRAQKQIIKNNRSKERFLFYPWGVWITAYARRAVYMMIHALGPAFVYCDTDSIKCLCDTIPDCILQYNEMIQEKIRDNLTLAGINPSLASPKDQKGKEHPIGVFEDEGIYDQFVTLGAKRYAYYRPETDDNGITTYFHGVVAGCPKKAINKYLEVHGLDGFHSGLKISAADSGKLRHTYIDEATEEVITDNFGNSETMRSQGSIILEPITFEISDMREIEKYLLSRGLDIQKII